MTWVVVRRPLGVVREAHRCQEERKRVEVQPCWKVEVEVHKGRESKIPSYRPGCPHNRDHYCLGARRAAHKVPIEVALHQACGVDLVKVREMSRRSPVCPVLAFPVQWASRVLEAC